MANKKPKRKGIREQLKKREAARQKKKEVFIAHYPKAKKNWDELSKGTPVERAPLHFRFIKAEVQCMACFQKYHPSDGRIHCPYCGSYGAKVLSGEEFFLESIEFDDEQT